MNQRMAGDVLSLHTPITLKDGGETPLEWQDCLADKSPLQEQLLLEQEEQGNRLNALHSALGILNERERHILEARRLSDEPMTLQELGDELDISKERVRQIENRALEKIRAAVRAKMAQIEDTKQEEFVIA